MNSVVVLYYDQLFDMGIMMFIYAQCKPLNTAREYASPYNLNKKIAPDHFQHVPKTRQITSWTTETSKLINNITFQIRNTKFKTSINTAQFYGKQLM